MLRLKRNLNTMDLQENETLTFNDVVSRSQLKPTRNQTYQKPEDHYAEDDSLADAAAGFVAGLMVGNQSSKQNRINKLRKEVKVLDDEYKFERGFESEWYEDEHLSAKYKNRDEEKYLQARKEELRNANMAYDTYNSR